MRGVRAGQGTEFGRYYDDIVPDESVCCCSAGFCIKLLGVLGILTSCGLSGYYTAQDGLEAYPGGISEQLGLEGTAFFAGTVPAIYLGVQVLVGSFAGYKAAPVSCSPKWAVNPVAWLCQRAVSACTYHDPSLTLEMPFPYSGATMAAD